MKKNTLIGDIIQYDNSGVVQPGSSQAPVDTSVTNPNVDVPITLDRDPNKEQENAPSEEKSTPWLLLIGGAILLYFVIKKK